MHTYIDIFTILRLPRPYTRLPNSEHLTSVEHLAFVELKTWLFDLNKFYINFSKSHNVNFSNSTGSLSQNIHSMADGWANDRTNGRTDGWMEWMDGSIQHRQQHRSLYYCCYLIGAVRSLLLLLWLLMQSLLSSLLDFVSEYAHQWHFDSVLRFVVYCAVLCDVYGVRCAVCIAVLQSRTELSRAMCFIVLFWLCACICIACILLKVCLDVEKYVAHGCTHRYVYIKNFFLYIYIRSIDGRNKRTDDSCVYIRSIVSKHLI